MSRYLTPFKIALLTLTSIYADGLVPASQTTTVLSFLLSHILPRSDPPNADTNHVASITTLETALAACDSGVPGRTIWDLFLGRIWSLNCADSLELFMTNIPSLLAKSREELLRERESGQESGEQRGRIQRTSPLGAFIRRAHLEYTRLQFHGVASLWHDFLTYRLPTQQAWEKKDSSGGRNALDVTFSDLHIGSSHPIAQTMYGKQETAGEDDGEGLSMDDVERLMKFQVSALQSMGFLPSSWREADAFDLTGHGGRLPDDMRTKLKQMSTCRHSMPLLAHYLKLASSLPATNCARLTSGP
jgi:anaphase-promoting complex subunit 5